MPRKILASLLLALNLACAADEGAPAERHRAIATDTTSRESSTPVIAFLGTSLTVGLGLPDDEAFPALIQDTLDALELDFRVINAGENGGTSAGGLRRIDWLLQQPISILVLELGANDGLRGLDVETMRSNLQTIIDRTKKAHADAAIVILGMKAPPNMGRPYTTGFRRVFAEIAKANGASLVPFMLDSVGGIAELNQADGIHPTAEGHRIIARTVWRVLEGVVRDLDEQRTR